MNYIGSKKSLLEFIEKSINKIVSEKKYTFSDLFAGTGIVGRYFKEKGHKIIANDLQYYSFILNKNYIGNHKSLEFKGLFQKIKNLENTDIPLRKEKVLFFLDNLKLKKGFIYNNYSIGGTKGKEFERQYFSDENASKCDTIRQKIENWKQKNNITENEYYFLLASLLESIDKVANTASVYGAFLKKLKNSAQKSMSLKSADFFLNENEHEVFNENISKLVKSTKHDVVYLDPPYNARQYSGNYHILETIAKYDNPKIKGKTGMRDCSKQKSNYCKISEVKKEFANLIGNINAKYIFLSYNDEGLMSVKDIEEILSTRGEYGIFKKKYRRFKADKIESRNHKKNEVVEYLHYVKVTKKTSNPHFF